MRNTIEVLKNMDLPVSEPRLEDLVLWLDEDFILEKDTKLEPYYAEWMLGSFMFVDGEVCPPDTLIGVDWNGDLILMPDIEMCDPFTKTINRLVAIEEIFGSGN